MSHIILILATSSYNGRGYYNTRIKEMCGLSCRS